MRIETYEDLAKLVRENATMLQGMVIVYPDCVTFQVMEITLFDVMAVIDFDTQLIMDVTWDVIETYTVEDYKKFLWSSD